MTGAISAVIICHDDGRLLEEAVANVRRQTRQASDLVIVDVDSRDLHTIRALQQLRQLGVRVVAVGSGGGAAFNAGARATDGDYLIFLAANNRLAPTCFAVAGRCLDVDAAIDFVCGPPDDDTTSGEDREWKALWVDALAYGRVPSSALMLRRALWEASGGCEAVLGRVAMIDFWVSAFHRGVRGRVLDADLVSQANRSGSDTGGLTSWRGGFELFAAIYDKHRDLVENSGDELLERKAVYLARQVERRLQLAAREAALEQEFSALRHEIGSLTELLGERQLSRVEWGDLRRTTPLSPVWGSDRGRVVNRYYIERFLAGHRQDIRGSVLEVKDPGYTEMFGSEVTRKEVLDIDVTNRRATIIADLADADHVPSDSFDCVILTQVLNIIQKPEAALGHVMRMLRPGGVLLCTVAAVDRISYEGRGVDSDYWRFTEASLSAVLATACPLEQFAVTTFGNVLSCCAFLYGLSTDELSPEELDVHDPAFPLIVAARAVKPVSGTELHHG